ncbi:MAG: rhomboid family intramembrane serine protease [Nannocystaceae bacterium]
MFDQLLFLVLVVQATTLLRLFRRGLAGQRGYAALVLGVLLAGLYGLSREDRFLGSVAISMCVITTVAPLVLDAASRWAYARSRIPWAVRLSGLRSFLMPGAGLSRHQRVLRALLILHQGGVDPALAYLRGLAEDSEDDGELALIHEHTVSLLFYGMRWDDAIANYERRFQPGYAALRPMLALGLLRAYGESGRLRQAAALLRALEEGPFGADPRSAEMLGQARFTFLAYAGASAVVDQVVAQDRCRDLGLSPAAGALFHGIALARSGDVGGAETALRSVATVAGPRDARAVEASRFSLKQLPGESLELAPEVLPYVQSVADRLLGFLRVNSTLRPRGRVVLTYAIVLAIASVFGVMTTVYGTGAIDLLRMGAWAPGLWASGSWARVLTSVWVHSDLVGLLFNMYAIWLAGHVVERFYGAARMGLAVIGSAVLGMGVGVMAEPGGALISGGGSLLACAALVSALWALLPLRTPEIVPRVRRSLSITLGLLLGANLLTVVPGVWGFDTLTTSYVATVLCASLIAAVPRLRVKSAFDRFCAVLLFALGLSLAWAAYRVVHEDVPAYLLAHRDQICASQGVRFHVPPYFGPTPAVANGPPGSVAFDGIADRLELRTGALVEYVAVDPTDGDGAQELPALFGVVPNLRHAFGVRPTDVPASLRSAVGAEAEGWRAWILRESGAPRTLVIERALQRGEVQRRVLLLSSPPEAVERSGELYAAILAGAHVSRDPDENGCGRVAPETSE